jgi:hypothetical protein
LLRKAISRKENFRVKDTEIPLKCVRKSEHQEVPWDWRGVKNGKVMEMRAEG